MKKRIVTLALCLGMVFGSVSVVPALEEDIPAAEAVEMPEEAVQIFVQDDSERTLADGAFSEDATSEVISDSSEERPDGYAEEEDIEENSGREETEENEAEDGGIKDTAEDEEDEVAEAEAEEAEAEENLEQASAPTVTYHTHVQSVGWQGWKKNGEMSGTSGQSKRLEGIEIKVSGSSSLGIRYKTHIQTYGWESSWKTNGQMSGTTGQSKRLEAIRIELTGSDASKYDVWYCVHAQNFGWLNWAKNGADAGTAGYSYRLEGIKIRILPKGSSAPAKEGNSSSVFYSKSDGPAVNKNITGVAYNTHVQTFGWQDYAYNGSVSGTSGQSKRLEGIHISLVNPKYSGGIEYCTHVQSIGWQDWKSNGAMSGTSGQSKRLEAIRIRLTGTIANYYDVYYRVHAQNFGWMGWAKNGEQAGTAGYSYRLEAIQIVLVNKGGSAPSKTLNGCTQKTNMPFVKGGDPLFSGIVWVTTPGKSANYYLVNKFHSDPVPESYLNNYKKSIVVLKVDSGTKATAYSYGTFKNETMQVYVIELPEQYRTYSGKHITISARPGSWASGLQSADLSVTNIQLVSVQD